MLFIHPHLISKCMDSGSILSIGGKTVSGIINWVTDNFGMDGLLCFLLGATVMYVYNTLTNKLWKLAVMALIIGAVLYVAYSLGNPNANIGDAIGAVNNMTGGGVNITETW